MSSLRDAVVFFFFFSFGGGIITIFFTCVDWRFWRKHNKATSKKRSGVILKKERRKKKTHRPHRARYDCANEEASLFVIFLAPHSVADCICCDYPSLVSAVSSISAFVSALLLPALCLMCAPCILTVVDFSAYGRSDSTRRPLWPSWGSPSPGRGGGGAGGGGLVWEGGGLDCNDDDNECYGFLSFLQA